MSHQDLDTFNAKKFLVPPQKGKVKTPKIDTKLLQKSVQQQLAVYLQNAKLAIKQATAKVSMPSPPTDLYTSPEHKAYCKSTKRNASTIDPIVYTTIRTALPLKFLSHNGASSLNARKPVFVGGASVYDMTINNMYNNYNRKYLDNKTLTTNANTLPIAWMKKQMKYIQSLSMYDVYTIRGYSFIGDTIANSTLVGTPKYANDHDDLYDAFPFYFQVEKLVDTKQLDILNLCNEKTLNIKVEFIKEAHEEDAIFKKSNTVQGCVKLLASKWSSMKRSVRFFFVSHLWEHFKNDVKHQVTMQFIQDLDRILSKAPVLDTETTVYRGVRSDYYLTGAKNNIYQNVGFVSTSIDVQNALDFLNKEQSCCLQKITMLPGTPVLMLMPISEFNFEKELLLNHGSTYYINTPVVKKEFYNTEGMKQNDICFNSKKTHMTKVSEIVILPH